MPDSIVKRIPNKKLLKLGYKMFNRCDRQMRESCAGSPDALKFGWDWPTFRVYFPRRYRHWRKLADEILHRGLVKGKLAGVRG